MSTLMVVSGALGPWLLTVVPVALGWVVLALVAMVVGAAWTLVLG